MKKILTACCFALLISCVCLNQRPAQAQYYGPTFRQLQNTADDSNSAANSYQNGSYDEDSARSTSGYNFDTPSSSAPAVDLRDAGEHPTPMLLRGPND